jgi:hypothetical protein
MEVGEWGLESGLWGFWRWEVAGSDRQPGRDFGVVRWGVAVVRHYAVELGFEIRTTVF